MKTKKQPMKYMTIAIPQGIMDEVQQRSSIAQMSIPATIRLMLLERLKSKNPNSVLEVV